MMQDNARTMTTTGDAIRSKVSSGAARWAPPGFVPPELHGTIRDRIEAGTHFRVEGRGPAVVLIHGVGLDLEMWGDHVDALTDKYSVIRYDMLGHGASAKPPGELTLRSFVAQLAMVFDYFRLDQAPVIGFSMGALVAQGFALDRADRVAGLILLNGVYNRSPAALRNIRDRVEQADAEGPRALIEAALERWFTPHYRANRPDVVDRIRQRLNDNDRYGFLAAYRVFAGDDAEFAGRLQDIGCPTLVVTGGDDPGSTPAMTLAMAEAIPNARSRVLPGLRHMAPVEGAAEVGTLIGDFLATLDASRA